MLFFTRLQQSIALVAHSKAESLFCRHSPAPSTYDVDSRRTRRLAALGDDGGNVKIDNGSVKRDLRALARVSFSCSGTHKVAALFFVNCVLVQNTLMCEVFQLTLLSRTNHMKSSFATAL